MLALGVLDAIEGAAECTALPGKEGGWLPGDIPVKLDTEALGVPVVPTAGTPGTAGAVCTIGATCCTGNVWPTRGCIAGWVLFTSPGTKGGAGRIGAAAG